MSAEAVAEVDRALRIAHGGGLEEVRPGLVRFTGMCTACPTRPLCFEHSIRPLLGDVDVVGMRISDEAKERLRGH